MKLKSLSKDTRREFKKSFSRFISITVIICLGVGFFSGMKAAAPTMIASAEKIYNEGNLMDIELLSALGFGDEDVEKVRAVEGVKDAYPSYSVDALVKFPGDDASVCVKTYAYNKDNPINTPKLLEGRMPKNRGECVICAKDIKDEEYKIGEKLKLDETAGKTDMVEVLYDLEYEVVGIIELPMYFSFNYGTTSVGDGNVYSFMMIPEEEFLYARYTEMYVTADMDREKVGVYTEEYDNIISEVKQKLEPIGVESLKTFKEELEKQLSESEEELNKQKSDAYDKLDDSKKQLDDANAQLTDALTKLTSGWNEYNTSYDDYLAQMNDAENQLNVQRDMLMSYKRQLSQSVNEYNAGVAELQASRTKLDNGWAEYNSGLAEYNSGLKKYNDGLSRLNSGKAQLDSAKQELDAARIKLDNGWGEYDKGVEEYNAGVQKYEDGKKQYKDSVAELNAMQKEYTEGTWDESGSLCLTNLKKYMKESMDATAFDYAWRSLTGVFAKSARQTAIQTMLNEYSTALDDARVEIDNGKKELDSAKAQLNSAKAELDTGEAEYKKGKAEYDAGVATYNKEYNANKATLDNAKKELDSANKTLIASKKQLDDGESEYKAGQQKLADANVQITDAQKQISDGEVKLADGEKQIADAKAMAADKFSVSKKELDDAQKKYDDGKKQYDDGVKQYEDAKKEAERKLSEGAAQIQNAKSQFLETSTDKWYVFTRDDVVGNYTSLGQDAGRIDAIAGLFPVFFLVVAALVCVTTMSRMVEEQRSQMGAYKALGYSKRQILSKYLKYALTAGLVGGIIGQLICVQIFPRIIINAYKMMYVLKDVQIVIPWIMLGISLIAGIACTAFVAFVCCNKEVKLVAATLMRPKAPKAGKKILLERIPFIWNRFGFSLKITLRNLFRYKVRFLMTVIGITGCMALIVSGFGLQNSIDPIVDLQYKKLSDYDVIVSMYEPYTGEQADKCKQLLMQDDANIDRLLFVKQLDITAKSEKVKTPMANSYLLVPENMTDFEALQHLNDVKTGEHLELHDGEAVITGKMADTLDIEIGDEVTFTIEEKDYKVKVSGIAENYVYHYIYITPETYEDIFENDITYNAFMAATLDGDVDSKELLAKNPNFLTAIKVSYICNTMDENFTSMYLVIVVLIVSASALAIVVLYNLTNINISERIREIATTKVLGFNQKESNMDVFRENIIMTVIGLIFGNICGYLLAQVMISMVEDDMVVFSRVIQPTSYIYSSLITIGITFIVFLLMKSKIKKIDMVEALKSIE